jgi:hypothetical protein
MASLRHSATLTPSIDVPQTQNTAPVLEFRCLFTSDLRQKHKRWQDGRVKFHTFNKRIMVYDERSNFVGDSHWRKDYEFEEGEELELERGSTLLQVGECIGARNQDLTELLNKRAKEKEGRAEAMMAASPVRPQISRPAQMPAGNEHLRPKSLNAVIGNPTGNYGRSVVSSLSPFEQRQANTTQNENGRPAKRRRQNESPPSKNGYAQSLMGTPLTLTSSRLSSTPSIRYETLRRSVQLPRQQTIDLTADGDEKEQIRPKVSAVSKDLPAATLPPRQKHAKSPAISGYASALKGATLSLESGPSISRRADHGSKHFTKSKVPKGRAENSTLSSRIDRRIKNSNDDSVTEKVPADISRAKECSTKKNIHRFSTQSSLPDSSSSPSPNIEPREVFAAPILHNSMRKDSSAAQDLTEPAFSSLRIKAHPPRKLMMMQGPPPSRSSAAIGPVHKSSLNSESIENLRSALEEIPFSHSIPDLLWQEDRETEEDEETVQAATKLEFSAGEEMPSSPLDREVNHQMIDDVLLRKTKAPKKSSSVASSITCRDLGQNTLRDSSASKAALGTVSSETTKLSTPAPVSLVKENREPSRSNECVQKASARTPHKISKPTQLESQCPIIASNAITADKEVLRACSTEQDVITKSLTSPLVSDLDGFSMSSYVPRLPDHMSSTTISATESFQAMIKPSGRAAESTSHKTPRSGDSYVTLSTNADLDTRFPKIESASSTAFIKPSPQSTPPSISGLGYETHPNDNPEPANYMNGTSDTLNSRRMTMATANIAPRLVNPATRGPSIQMTANRAVNATSLALIGMHPPPPVPGSRYRVGAIPEQSDVGASRAPRAPAKAVTLGGPWSRESFDLFGAWRPPGRDRTANISSG